MARKRKDQEEMIKNAEMLEHIAEEDIQEVQMQPTADVAVEETEERMDIDNIVTEEEIQEANEKKVKIKELKYGFSVLSNIGNFENIRTQIEVSADIDENDSIEDVLNVLSKQVKDWGRREYKDIKRRTQNK